MGDAYGAAIIEEMSKHDMQMLSHQVDSKSRLNDSTNDVAVLSP